MLDIITLFVMFIICCLIPTLIVISLVLCCLGWGVPGVITAGALRGAYKIP